MLSRFILSLTHTFFGIVGYSLEAAARIELMKASQSFLEKVLHLHLHIIMF
jgi:hypothetical protein